MKNIAEILNEYTKILLSSNSLDIKTARLEAEILLSHVMGINRSFLIAYTDKTIDEKAFEYFDALIKRRLSCEPIAYIIGTKEFYGQNYYVDKNVLIPRPETEELIDIVIDNINAHEHVLDIGTGSGCIAIALKTLMPSISIAALDISEEALKIAKKNALNILGHSYNIEFIHTSIENYKTNIKFDAIVSNPPYISLNEKDNIMSDVRLFEPRSALFSGVSGYEFYEMLNTLLDNILKKNGRFFFEIGERQEERLKDIFSGKDICFIKDLSNKSRFLIGRN